MAQWLARVIFSVIRFAPARLLASKVRTEWHFRPMASSTSPCLGNVTLPCLIRRGKLWSELKRSEVFRRTWPSRLLAIGELQLPSTNWDRWKFTMYRPTGCRFGPGRKLRSREQPVSACHRIQIRHAERRRELYQARMARTLLHAFWRARRARAQCG